MKSGKGLILLILFIIILKSTSSEAQTTQVREKLSFNTDWKFSIGDNPEFRNAEFNDASWRTLNLPHDWSIEGDCKETRGGAGGFFPIGIGWYRKTFALPEAMKHKQVIIQFDGVYMNSEVWINDHFLGRYPYGFTTFQYDLTEFLKKGTGETNTIAVRVDNSLKESTRWYTGSGIYRNVWLVATNFVHFDNYKGVLVTTSEVSIEKATVNVNYEFASNFFSYKDYEKWKADQWNYKPELVTKTLLFRSVITDKNGNELARNEKEKQCTNFQSYNQINQQIQIVQPRIWSSKFPEIYDLKSEIICDGKVIDDQVTSFGIRKLEYIPGKGMFVNDKPEKLKGVCLHQDAGSFGVAVPIQVWRNRLLKLKEAGCNAVRTAHTPFAPEFYDLCDSLGFYVMDEAFDEWTTDWFYNYTANTQGKAQNGYHLYFNQWAETDLKAMIQRDRNHPSIVMYSIGNEIPDQKASCGTGIAKKLISICHNEDNTRPVTSGCNEYMYSTQNGFIDALDISGYNYIDRDFGDKMYGPEYQKRPDKLCIGTETNKQLPSFIWCRDKDYVIGGFIWVGIDYWGESDEYPRRGFFRGILDLSGFEKPEYYLFKAYWNEKPTVHLAVSKTSKTESRWDWKSAESKWNWIPKDSVSVYVISNCDEVELFLNNRSLGTKVIDKNLNYYGIWPLKYKEGTLKAIGYIAKIKVAEDVLKTAAEASKLIAKPDKTLLKADGKDISMIEISIVDKNGTLVPDAANEIKVNIHGEAALIGLDNGDIYYTGLFKTNIRKLFKGKLMVTVQSTTDAGTATLELISEKTGTLKVPLKSVR